MALRRIDGLAAQNREPDKAGKQRPMGYPGGRADAAWPRLSAPTLVRIGVAASIR